MQEITVPEAVRVPESTNTTIYVERLAAEPESKAIFAVPSDNGWQDIHAKEFRADVVALAKGLIAQGIAPGERIGIMSRTRYEWSLVDFAIWYAGAVSVPIYESSSPSQIAWNLEDSGAIAAFAETRAHADSMAQAVQSASLADLRAVWLLEGDGLDQLRVAGREVSDDEVEKRRTAAGLRDVATIIYTSGTTGKPKGTELTHGNFVELADNAMAVVGSQVVTEGAQTIMFLPLAHVFGRFIAILNLAGGARVAHSPDIKHVVDDFQSFSPTYILAVPRVFEKVYNTAVLTAESSGKGKIFHQAADVAVEWSRAKQNGKVPFGLNLKHAIFAKLVYSKLRKAMGGQLEYAVSGGGPLGERLGHFFYGIGVTIMEGWGLTETTAPVTVNTPDALKIGTVGKPLPSNAVKIAEDGEVLVKGTCVMKGYHNREDLTAEAMRDGWFHSGDLGVLDDEGFLTITGRKKEIIVTAGGKNVAPAMLEDQIRADALVSQVVVIGEGKPFIAALVTLDEESLPQLAAHYGLAKDVSAEEAAKAPSIQKAVQAIIDTANESVSHAEQIKSFRIVPTDFTEESGHLTPSLKIKRAAVLKDFDAVVQDIYNAPKPVGS